MLVAPRPFGETLFAIAWAACCRSPGDILDTSQEDIAPVVTPQTG